MQVLLNVALDVPDNIAAQVQRHGLTVIRHGTHLRVKVGQYLVATNKAVVTIEPDGEKPRTNHATTEPKVSQ